MNRNQVCLVLSLGLVALAILCCSPVSANSELDSLADKLANSLSVVNNKLGFQGATPSGSSLTAVAAEEEMKKLYDNIEKLLSDARQRAAISRSASVTSKIDSLRLI